MLIQRPLPTPTVPCPSPEGTQITPICVAILATPSTAGPCTVAHRQPDRPRSRSSNVGQPKLRHEQPWAFGCGPPAQLSPRAGLAVPRVRRRDLRGRARNAPVAPALTFRSPGTGIRRGSARLPPRRRRRCLDERDGGQLYRCAYSIASWVFPTPPMPCRAWTAARLPDSRVWRMLASRSSRPVKDGFRAGTLPHPRTTGGNSADEDG